MSNTNAPNVLELKTKVEVGKSMKLVDIHGKKISFQSDCFVHATQSKQKEPPSFYIAIVNQNDLDNGKIQFEIHNGKTPFTRRVTYESADGEHLNHYIAVKKLPNTDEDPIHCDITIRLSEIVPTASPEPTFSMLPEVKYEEEEIDTPKENPIAHTNDQSIYKNIAIGCFILVVLLVVLRK